MVIRLRHVLLGVSLACCGLLLAGIGLVARCLLWQGYSVAGPESAGGVEVRIQVSDAGCRWSSDYYADVELRDAQGMLVGSWEDPNGRGSSAGVRAMVQSMRWVDEDTLVFKDDWQGVTLNVHR